jgi:hypothetical protein
MKRNKLKWKELDKSTILKNTYSYFFIKKERPYLKNISYMNIRKIIA